MTAIRITYGKPEWPFDLAAGNALPGDDDAVWPASLPVVPPEVPTAGAAAADSIIDGIANPGAVTNTVTVGTDGAVAMAAPAAISTYKVDGTGIRIGILSDSFNVLGGEAADIAAGNLPADGVTILQEGPSGAADEGRAMAELIHAVAPGAQLYFYSADISEASFADGIIALAQQGCSVIVDDVTYFDEPFFQDGAAVQTAVEDVVAEGVSYFTAASNAGDNFYQATFKPITATLPGGVGKVKHAQDFTNGTALQSLTIAAGEPIDIDLQWNQPFATIGTGHSSQNSLSLYLFDSSNHLVASAVTDAVDGNPDQFLQFTNDTGASANYNLAIVWNGGTVQPGLLKYIVYSEFEGAATINDTAAGIGSGTVIGHELIPAANTVGAVDAADTPANGISPPQLESFSSVGPGEILFDANGNLLATPIDPQKVNFTAPDGIATSVFDPFYGTSAAAPDAAAVAALMLEANPNLTPAQVSADLANTAIPMSGGATADGAGFVQAPGAVQASFGIVWRAAAGGNWTTAAAWAGGSAPTASNPATLSDDFGTLDASYSVTVNTSGAAADTLTVGDAATLSVTLSISAGAGLTVTTGATVGQHGTLSVAGSGTLAVGGDMLVNIGAEVSIAAGGTMSAAAIDVEGTGAALTIAGNAADGAALTGAASGIVDIAAGGTLAVGSSASGADIALAAGGRLVLNALDAATLTTGLTSVITLDSSGVADIDLPGVAYNGGTDTLAPNDGTLTIASGATTLASLSFPVGNDYHFTQANDGGDGLLLGVACYCRGTHLATPAGEAAIEALRIGDMVLTAANAVRPVRWIGRRSYGRSHISTQRHLQPIRIRAGALGADAAGPLPRRDLRVSSEHALLLPDGTPPGTVLVPAHLLVNGATIVRETDRAEVDYFHLELDDHDAVLAEGAPAETFVDCNSRVLFDNAAEFAARFPNVVTPPVPRFCAPRIEAGPVLVRVLRRLHGLAGIVHGPLGGPTGGPAGGHLDRADREALAGWAYDHANPGCPVLLEIVLDGAVVGTALADRYRADMAALKFAGGYCAFRWNFAAPPNPGRRHIVAVRRAADGAYLRASPVLIDRVERPAAVLDDLRSAPAELRREVADFLTGEIERLRQLAAERGAKTGTAIG